MNPDIVSIDWCEDEIKKTLPWDESQYVTIKRLSGRDKRRRDSIPGKVRLSSKKTDDYEFQLELDKLKDFEWKHSIVDFCLKDGNGKVHTFGNDTNNQRVYDHISGELEKFIDDIIDEVEKSSEDVEEVSKNSEGSLEGVSKTPER